MEGSNDFESRMRNMILNNIGGASDNSDNVSAAGGHRPANTPSSQSSGKRLTQAQRRQGMTNKLDLSDRSEQFGQRNPRQSSYPQNHNHDVLSGQRRPFNDNRFEAQSLGAREVFQDAGPGPNSTNNATAPPDNLSTPRNWQHFASHPQMAPNYNSRQPGPTLQQQRTLETHNSPRLGGLSVRPAQPVHDGFRDAAANRTHSINLGSGGPIRSNDTYGRPPVPGRSLYDPQSQTHANMDMRPPYRQAVYLDQIAAARIPVAGMSEQVLHENEYIRRELESLCRITLRHHPDTNDIDTASVALECFGSIASGFATAGSDMDIMLVYDSHTEQTDKHKGIPRIVEKAFLDAGYGARLLTRTRVPIIRFCERPPLDLLSKLRQARDEWDQMIAKRLAEGKSADDADDISEDHEEHEGGQNGDADDAQHEPANENEPSSKQADRRRSESSAKSGKSKKKAEPKKEAPPPPYKNDEERIRLFQLAIKEDWFEPPERRLIYDFAEAHKQCGGDLTNEALQKARTALNILPDVLSRYREPRERKQELEYPKDGVGVLCDINFATGTHSNPLAIHNTRLLRCYSMFDDRIRQMVIFVKAWAKIRKINKPYHGTLSSYGYVLLVLHFALNIANPPLAPNLQLLHDRNAQTGFSAPETCNDYDIRFWQDPQAIQAAAGWEFGSNQQSVGSLLCQFFRYYAVTSYKGMPGFQWMKDVLSLRTPGGLLSKEQKGWTGAHEQAKDGEDGQEGAVRITHRYLVAIEDPFEHSHNVGRPVMHHGIMAIRDEFRRANMLILNNGWMNNAQEDLFAEGVEKERIHRYFGPNPKHQRPAKFGPKNLVGEAREKALEKARKLAEKEAAQAQQQAEPTRPVKSATVSDGAEGKQEADETAAVGIGAGSAPKQNGRKGNRGKAGSNARQADAKPTESDQRAASEVQGQQGQNETGPGEQKKRGGRQGYWQNRRRKAKESAAQGPAAEGPSTGAS